MAKFQVARGAVLLLLAAIGSFAGCAFDPPIPSNIACDSDDDCKPFGAICRLDPDRGANVCCRGSACSVDASSDAVSTDGGADSGDAEVSDAAPFDTGESRRDATDAPLGAAEPGPAVSDAAADAPDTALEPHDLAAPTVDTTAVTPDTAAPPPDAADPPPDVAPQGSDVAPPRPDVATPSPDVATPSPDVATPSPDVATPSPDVAAPPPDLASTTPDMAPAAPDVAPDGQPGPDAPPPGSCPLAPPSDGCTGGTAKCGRATCSVLLDTDPANCGRCGRSCGEGAQCQAGNVLPVTLVNDQALHSAPLITVNAGGVFWGTYDGKVIHLPFGSGANPTTLASDQGMVFNVVADEDFVYAVISGDKCAAPGHCLRRIAIAGAQPKESTVALVGYGSGFAADSHGVYWFDTSGPIRRFPTKQSGPTPPPQVIAADQAYSGQVSGIAIDGEYVYWSPRNVAAGEGIIRRARLDATNASPNEITRGTGLPTNLAVDGTHVYWTDYGAGEVRKTPKQGGGPVTPIATAQGGPWEVVVDDLSVYWNFGGGGNGIRKVSLCGGDVEQATSSGPAPGIAVWNGSLYWNDNVASIFRVAR